MCSAELKTSYLAAFLCCTFGPSVSAQSDADLSVKSDTVIVTDTVLYQPDGAEQELAASDTVNLEMRLIQKPTHALLKSLFVPGLGQIGNRRYIKAGVAIGLETWFIISAVHYARQANEFRRLHEASADVSVRNEYYNLYENRSDNSNKYRWFAGIVIFISMFDAYVDAHLSGAPYEERNRLDLTVWHTGDTPGASLSYGF